MISVFALGSDDDCSRKHVIYSLGARATLFDQCKRKDLSTWFYNSPVTSGKDSVKAWWWAHLIDVARSNIRCCSAGVLTGSPTGLKYIMQNVEERLQMDRTSAKWSAMRIVRLRFSDQSDRSEWSGGCGARGVGWIISVWDLGGPKLLGDARAYRRSLGYPKPFLNGQVCWTFDDNSTIFLQLTKIFGTFCERVNRFTSLYNFGRFHLRPYYSIFAAVSNGNCKPFSPSLFLARFGWNHKLWRFHRPVDPSCFSRFTIDMSIYRERSFFCSPGKMALVVLAQSTNLSTRPHICAL